MAIEPSYEPDDLDELWEPAKIFDRLVPLRSEILDGDLRPLYLAHLAVARDGNHDPEETVEGPVPAGLREPTDAQRALAEFYGIGETLVAAAARESGPLPAVADQRTRYAEWLAEQPEARKNAWLLEVLSDPGSSVRSEIRAEFAKASSRPSWPTVEAGRTLAQLGAAAEEIERDQEKEAAAKAARQRASRLKKMAAAPTPYLRKTEQLVAERSTDAYEQIGELLADLRDALAHSGQSDLAEKQARKLKTENPTLRLLTAALRRRGFLPK